MIKCAKWVSLLLLVGVVTGFVAWRSVFRYKATTRDAVVTLVGFTNVQGKGRCAVFAITNSTAAVIALFVDSWEHLVSGNWTRQALANATGITPEGRAWLSSIGGWEGRQYLKAGEGFVFHVAAPNTNHAWRIRFGAQEQEGRDGWRGIWGRSTTNSLMMPSDPARPNRRLFGWRVFSGRRYTFVTPQVE